MKFNYPALSISVLFLLLATTSRADSNTTESDRNDSIKVEKKYLQFDVKDRNRIAACVVSELGEWRYLSDDNIREKTVAMTWVVLRRAVRGYSGKKHPISAAILAPNQFYGITGKFDPTGSLFGKPEVHAVLSKLEPDYLELRKKDFAREPSEYIRSFLHLIPSDTTTGTDAVNFDRIVRAVTATVDAVLAGQASDNSKSAMFFGYVGDIYASKYHQPKNLVAAFGGLGPFKTVEALIQDERVKGAGFRMSLYREQGVDAIFFFK